MKAAAVRRCAERYDGAALDAAIEAYTEREEELLEVEGHDAEERLTHLLLARRIRERMEGGEDFKEAFRAEMGAVRDVLTNEA